ncbi:MAG: hypothetical protein GXO49_06085 [Chlorobi bacterium]|nr:hypothetical protein [Chlorobiota bacterium]
MRKITILFYLILFSVNFSYSQDDDDEFFIPKIKEEKTFKFKKHKYKVVKIGDDWWFAENFCYAGKDVKEIKNHEGTSLKVYTYEQAKKYCPKGWHIPSDEEWMKLEKELGMADNRLNTSNRSLNLSPALEDLNFDKNLANFNTYPTKTSFAIYWTSTELHQKDYIQTRYFKKPPGDLIKRYVEDKRFGYHKSIPASVRYVKNK